MNTADFSEEAETTERKKYKGDKHTLHMEINTCYRLNSGVSVCVWLCVRRKGSKAGKNADRQVDRFFNMMSLSLMHGWIIISISLNWSLKDSFPFYSFSCILGGVLMICEQRRNKCKKIEFQCKIGLPVYLERAEQVQIGALFLMLIKQMTANREGKKGINMHLRIYYWCSFKKDKELRYY